MNNAARIVVSCTLGVLAECPYTPALANAAVEDVANLAYAAREGRVAGIDSRSIDVAHAAVLVVSSRLGGAPLSEMRKLVDELTQENAQVAALVTKKQITSDELPGWIDKIAVALGVEEPSVRRAKFAGVGL